MGRVHRKFVFIPTKRAFDEGVKLINKTNHTFLNNRLIEFLITVVCLLSLKCHNSK